MRDEASAMLSSSILLGKVNAIHSHSLIHANRHRDAYEGSKHELELMSQLPIWPSK